MSFAAAAVALATLSGCVSSGLDLGVGNKPDTSLLSGSIDPALDTASDDAIIADAVAEAKIKPGYIQDIPWNNAITGNFGSVSFVRENKSVGKVCRDFIVSKHSYDGVMQYTGEICRTRLTKSWSLKQQG
ncbi:RT0821/Lpp0805 family surface protein [Hoeflea sp.]|uniref:RT0821/Lpp0805 family surface protein n=1 Tax=Hoeflea sp. TaxID=1940281 RepID=UPI003B0162F4